MMNSVSVQVRSTINDDISNQVLPQIQHAIMVGSGHMTKKGWNVPAERPETNPEGLRSEKARNDLRSEQTQSRQHKDTLDEYCAYDNGFIVCFPSDSEFFSIILHSFDNLHRQKSLKSVLNVNQNSTIFSLGSKYLWHDTSKGPSRH